jgi:hypothetical protein
VHSQFRWGLVFLQSDVQLLLLLLLTVTSALQLQTLQHVKDLEASNISSRVSCTPLYCYHYLVKVCFYCTAVQAHDWPHTHRRQQPVLAHGGCWAAAMLATQLRRRTPLLASNCFELLPSHACSV